MIYRSFFGETKVLGDVAQSLALVGVQGFQYGDLLIITAMFAIESLLCYALILALLKFQNFRLKRRNTFLKNAVVVLELRVALIKAGLIGEPSSNSAGEYSEERANGKRLEVHSGSLLANDCVDRAAANQH